MLTKSHYYFFIFLIVLFCIGALSITFSFTGNTVGDFQKLPMPKYPVILFFQEFNNWINKLPLFLEKPEPVVIEIKPKTSTTIYDFGVFGTGDKNQLVDDSKYVLSIYKSKLDPEFIDWEGLKVIAQCIKDDGVNVVYDFTVQGILRKSAKTKTVTIKSASVVFPKEFCYQSIFPDETHFRIKTLCDEKEKEGGIFVIPLSLKYSIRLLGNEVYAPMHRRPTQRLSRFVQFQGNCV